MRFSAHDETEDLFAAAARELGGGIAPHGEPLPSVRSGEQEERFGLLRSALSSLTERPVIGFACCPGANASATIAALGSELACDGKRVVTADLDDMRDLTLDDVECFDPDLLLSDGDGLFRWRLESLSRCRNPRNRNALPPSSDPRIWFVEVLRSIFDYVLLEAPALDTGLKPVLLAALADAVVLTVQAGKTRVSQIERAKKTLELVNANVIGCVLTGRRYPVPDWIYKRL